MLTLIGRSFVTLLLLGLFANTALGVSNPFPATVAPPTPGVLLPTPVATKYCSPSGSNTTGNGSIGSPWLDLRGAQTGGAGTPVAAGNLLYLRGGTYPDAGGDWANSNNKLSINGTSENPIVITNYPGEIAVFQDNGDKTGWLLTLGGNYQKLIGTMVGGSYGIQVAGGASWMGSYQHIVGVDFSLGTENGADYNPAMLSLPVDGMGITGTVISHNRFRDAITLPIYDRNVAIRLFQNISTVIEYNIFVNNSASMYLNGAVFFKDDTIDAVIRHNKFINTTGGIGYGGQVGSFNFEAYGNLFYNVTSAFSFISYLNNTGKNIVGHNNVVINSTSFLYYLNADTSAFTEHGDFYDNVIGTTTFEKGWHADSSNSNNIPDLFNYNLYYLAANRNTPTGWTLRAGYYANDVISANAVTYDAVTMTATVGDAYAGIGAGRYGGTIGGFAFGGADTTPPAVFSTSPTNGATGVALNSNITVNYNEPITCATPTISVPGATVGTPTCVNSTLTIPVSGQANSTVYNVSINGIKDTAATPNTQTVAHTFSYTTVSADAAAPTCTAFTLATTSQSLTVPVTALSCTDNTGVTGYFWSETTNPPGIGASWQSVPSTITVGGVGTRTVYLWARDAAGNISASRSSTTTVSETPASPASGGVKMGISGKTRISPTGAGRYIFQQP